jgi:WD40 repeat protein
MTEQSPAETIFFAALEKGTPNERAAYLDAACGDDRNLRQRVERLLAAHPHVGGFLEPPAQADALAEEARVAPPEVSQARTASYQGSVEAIGTVIAGRYKLLQSLGEGGMGAVFMAQQTEPVKRLVAVKLIRQGLDSKQILARFEAERQALALMDHPNIARVLDAGATQSGRPFFIMELVKGVPITQFCDDRQLSPRERLELFIPVCQAIQHAHQKGIIHRDIKPTNVLVALYDDRPVPKIIDFGVAKAAGSQLTDASLVTGFGAIVGTPEYMSPEQAQLNQLDIDTRSDVYSLGVLLYELLTGTTPIDRKRLAQQAVLEILRVIREEEPPRPSTRLSTSEALASIAATRRTDPAKLTKLMRGELDWIVMKCLEKERSRRYETANGLARDLERYLHDEVVEARPPSAGYRLRKLARKHRAALAMATTVLSFLVAAVALTTWLAVRARRAENETAQALTASQRNELEAQQQRQEADEQRKKAETQAASLAVDTDLKYCEDGQVAVGLLRLADTLQGIPEHAKALRENATLNILAWAQRLRPVWRLNHDGFDVTHAEFSPDRTTLCTVGLDGTCRLWDCATGRERAILAFPAVNLRYLFTGPDRQRLRLSQFSSDGSTLATIDTDHPDYLEFHPHLRVKSVGHAIVRLWDAASGQFRCAVKEQPGVLLDLALSGDGSLLVTTCLQESRVQPNPFTVLFWDGHTGRLLRQVQRSSQPQIDVSRDGTRVLMSENGQFGVWYSHVANTPKPLPGFLPAFSPDGNSAVSFVYDAALWWNTKNWQLDRRAELPIRMRNLGFRSARLLSQDVALVETGIQNEMSKLWIVTKNLAAPIEVNERFHEPDSIAVLSNDRIIAVGADLYDAATGQPLALPRGRAFHPQLSELSVGGRFISVSDSSIVDIETDKKIEIAWAGSGCSGFLASAETWVQGDQSRPKVGKLITGAPTHLVIIRMNDAKLTPDLLKAWCHVITRGKLDGESRFSPYDEKEWQKAREKLSQQLPDNNEAQSLRPAAMDRLYWLRCEIENSNDATARLSLLDRLVASEPIWRNYAWRAGAHVALGHWDPAIQDDLDAARLAGQRYWHGAYPGLPWQVAAHSVQFPGQPREQYQRALEWVEARTQAKVSDEPSNSIQHVIEYKPRRTTIAGLALFRLGRYADALTTLHRSDAPMVAEAAGMLMSPWNAMKYSKMAHPTNACLASCIPRILSLKNSRSRNP